MPGEHLPDPELSSVPEELAEETLGSRFRRRILWIAVRRLGDPASAEDVAQETLKRVVGALREGRVRDLTALPGFVYQTARHVCQQWQRKAGRESRAFNRLAREEREEDPDSQVSRLISAERRLAVLGALERLDEGDRDLLKAIYFDETEVSTLAERLSLTPGALRVRKHRALKRLGELLGSNAAVRPGTW